MTNLIETTFRKLFPLKANEPLDDIQKFKAILNADTRTLGEEAIVATLCEGFELYERNGASETELRLIVDHIEEHLGVPVNWDGVPTIRSFLDKGGSISFIAAKLKLAA